MANATSTEIAGRQLQLSNTDKVLWEEDGYTKGDLIQYYTAVFPYMGPHLHQRPLVFKRYPNGISKTSFYQKNAPEHLPDWIETFAWEGSEGKPKNYILANEAADMAWLANQACLEIHPWLSRITAIDYPDFIVFDLDPSEQNTFAETVNIARLMKQLMDELDLRVYLKTSGARGLHIYLPIVNQYTYAQVRDFGLAVAKMICKVLPDIATIERPLQRRGRRIYVDYLQNGLGKTVCAPYSVRPRRGATISTPLTWQELSDIHPDQFTIRSLPGRLQQTGDLFQEVLHNQQELKKAVQLLGISL